MKKILPVILTILISLNAQALFEVKDASDNTVFSISNDGMRVINAGDTMMVISTSEARISLGNSKGLSRSFSVSTNTTGKGALANVLEVTTDATSMREGVLGERYTDFSPENIFIGLNSGMNTTPLNETMGENNVFLGNESGRINTTGAANVFIGYKSGYSNDTGFKNCFIGQESGFTNYNGRDNVFMGYRAGYLNYNGDFNVFIGKSAGNMNTSGDRNVFIGNEAGLANTTGWGNTYVGEQSGYINSEGYGNSYFGRYVGESNEGNYNTCSGYESIVANQTGSYNSCYGAFSGKWNYSSGSSNALFGYRAGYGTAVFTNTYNNNSFFGTESGFSTATGSNNAYFGYQAGYSVTTGSGNVFLGYQAGYNETGSELLYIDNSNTSQPLIWGDFDANWIKINGDFDVKDLARVGGLRVIQGAIIDESLTAGNTTINGTFSTSGTAAFNGTRTSVIHPVGQTTNGLFIQSTYNSNTDSWHFYQSTGDNLTLWYNTTLRGTWNLTTGVYTSSSDKRFKKNIEELTKVIGKVMLLQPKKYNFISQKNNDDKYIGLIAQDVEKLFPEFVMYNEEADAYTMDYAGLSVVAIQAIKEQQEKIEQLEMKIDKLSSLQAEIEEIKKLLNK